MPVAEIVDDRICVYSEMREKELTKKLPGVRWDTGRQVWRMPLSWAACQQLRGVFGDSLQVGEGLAAWAQAEIANRIAPCLALRTASDAEELAVMSALRPFQRAGAWFLCNARQALLADDMGLGKTVQAIAAMEALGDAAYPALIICPNSVKFNWADEIRKWAPSRLVVVIDGTAPKRREQIERLVNGDVQVGVINYESMIKHTRLAGYGSTVVSEADKTPKELNAIDFSTVIADEAHRVKEPKNKQTRALWAVGDPARHRFALTGTPIANGPEDIWSLMRFVAPLEYPVKTKFMERYADEEWNMWGFKVVTGIKSETKDELFRILDPRFIRRTKAQVLPELPPKQYVTRSAEMGAAQKKAYEAMRKDSMAELEGDILLATSPLVKLTRLIQFASCTGTMEGEQLKLTTPSCKVDALMEIVDELGDEQALVFAESRQLIDLATQELLKAEYAVKQVVGGQSAPDRAEAVASFNARTTKLLCITLAAGGEGLSFPGCTTAIFLQRSFNSVLNVQAEDRVYGIGRGDERVGSTIIDVITRNTIESHVHQVRQEKADQLEAFARDKETLKLWLAKS